ncbi:unnamed protein product [Rhizophagus irregularis]|nr:unnamed protein product [Rhizophagus irregularis]
MEIVRELKLQRDVVIHNNILRLYGITKDESENNYLLVMDGIVHRDLHSRLREAVIPGTPEDYVKLYTECWDDLPDNRPTI